MARGLNKVELIGNLGRDPELRYTQGGVAVANFSIATTEQWKDGDGNKQEHTEWHRIVAWRQLGEIAAQYLTKGSQVYIEGRIRSKKWEDSDGNERTGTEILLDRMLMLGGGSQSQSQGQGHGGQGGGGDQSRSGPITDDDIPF